MWRELKEGFLRSALSNIVIVCGIAVFVIVSVIYGSIIANVIDTEKDYRPEYSGYVYSEIADAEEAQASLADASFDYGVYCYRRSDSDTSLLFIDSAVASHFRSDTKGGKWFSSEYTADVYEAVAPDTGYYVKGNTYTVRLPKTTQRITFKIIDVYKSDRAHFNTFSYPAKLTICMPTMFEVGAQVIAFDTDEATFSASVKGVLITPARTIYDAVTPMDRAGSKFAVFMLAVVAAILLMSISAKVFLTMDTEKKRSAVYTLCGERRISLIAARILEVLITYAAGMIIALLMIPLLMSGLSISDPAKMIASVSAIVFAGYAGISSIRIIIIIKADPLIALRRNDL